MSDQEKELHQADRRVLPSKLQDIDRKLKEGSERMAKMEDELRTLKADVAANTALTRQVVVNTQGFTDFSKDIANGARFMCRAAKGVQFILRDVVTPYWRPVLVVWVVVYFVTHDDTLPKQISDVVKLLVGS